MATTIDSLFPSAMEDIAVPSALCNPLFSEAPFSADMSMFSMEKPSDPLGDLFTLGDIPMDDVVGILSREPSPLSATLTPPLSPMHMTEFSSPSLESHDDFMGSISSSLSADDMLEGVFSLVDSLSSDGELSLEGDLIKRPSQSRKARKARATPYSRPTNKPVATLSKAGSAPIDRSSPEFETFKRVSHNVSERQRRQDLKKSFDTLRSSIPAVADKPRVHTGQILRSAHECILDLQREERELEANLAHLRATNARLRASLGMA